MRKKKISKLEVISILLILYQRDCTYKNVIDYRLVIESIEMYCQSSKSSVIGTFNGQKLDSAAQQCRQTRLGSQCWLHQRRRGQGLKELLILTQSHDILERKNRVAKKKKKK
jgi:hypothetical protein